MRSLLAASLIAFIALADLTYAAAPGPAPVCEKQTRVRFLSGGATVPSRAIGRDDRCDGFGGDLVYTPRFHLYVYVNFNLPGEVDLDAVDAAFDLLPATSSVRDRFRELPIVVVDPAWLRETYGIDGEATLGYFGDKFFASGPVIAEGRLPAVLRAFYGLYQAKPAT